MKNREQKHSRPRQNGNREHGPYYSLIAFKIQANRKRIARSNQFSRGADDFVSRNPDLAAARSPHAAAAQILTETVASRGQISVDRIARASIEDDSAMFQHDSPRTQLLDRYHVVADEQNRTALPRNFIHLAEALLLERSVAYGKHFVDN